MQVAPALAAAVAVVPAAVIWIVKVPEVAEAKSVPEVREENTVADGVIVGEVSSVVAPDAEIAVVASVAVPVLVVRISAKPLVVPVGVCAGLAIMASVFVPEPAEITQGISHCHAHAFAVPGSVHEHTVVAVLTGRVMSDVTRHEFQRSKADSSKAVPFPTESEPATVFAPVLEIPTSQPADVVSPEFAVKQSDMPP